MYKMKPFLASVASALPMTDALTQGDSLDLLKYGCNAEHYHCNGYVYYATRDKNAFHQQIKDGTILYDTLTDRQKQRTMT